MLRALFAATLLPVCSACALERAEGPSCAGLSERAMPAVTQGAQPSMTPELAAETMIRMSEATEVEIEEALRARVAEAPTRRTVTLHVVTLSAGGQYGAFGAGFMRGWTDRPDFDLVTGVSAGALIAPVAFAGPAFDPLLDFYDGLGRDGVARSRGPLELLRAPSLADPAPLEAFVTGALDRPLIAALAEGDAEGRALLVGATNIDTGIAEVFDLGEAAARPDGPACIREALLASAAIPGLLPPRRIGPALYADGGLREHVFLRALDEARRDVGAEAGVTFRVEAYLIVNGALLPPAGAVDDRLTAYIARSAEILGDEVLRDSIVEAVDFAAARPDWRLRGIRATLTDVPVTLPDGSCGPGDDSAEVGGFDGCTTAALFAHGRALARDPIDWLSAEDLRALALEL